MRAISSIECDTIKKRARARVIVLNLCQNLIASGRVERLRWARPE